MSNIQIEKKLSICEYEELSDLELEVVAGGLSNLDKSGCYYPNGGSNGISGSVGPGIGGTISYCRKF